MPSVDLLAVHDDKETADVIELDRQDLDRYSKVGQYTAAHRGHAAIFDNFCCNFKSCCNF